jgi:hypothetical protein
VTEPYTFDEPDQVGGTRLNPQDIIDHLLLVWAVDYIEHSPTKFSKPDKPSDVIVVDVVDLDLPDEQGYAGFLCRASWWRQARLIGALRGRLSNPRPVLVHMTLGQATVGYPPYELRPANNDPECVARAQAWMAANPDFCKSPPRGRGEPTPVTQPATPAPVVAAAPREPSLLERLATQATTGATRLPPPPPPPRATEQPPF